MEETQETVKSSRHSSADLLIALGLAATALALYVRTLAPDVLPGDAGEFQFAAWRLGLAHPTGYPLYLLLGFLWQHLLGIPGVHPAAALNGLSALFAAFSVALLYLFMLDAPVSSLALRRVVAAFSAFVLATNLTFWSQAVIAEVYTLHTLLLLSLLLALQRAAGPSLSGSGSQIIHPRWLEAAALVFGLSLAHHAMILLAVPGILAYLWSVDPKWWRLGRRPWLMIVAALLVPLTLYAYIPLRSGPEASPWYHQRLGGTTLSLYENTWASFVDFVTGQSISVGFHDAEQALASVPAAARLWIDHFGWIGLVLMALGIYVLAVKRRPLLWLTAGIALAQQAFNLFYAIGDIGVYYIPLYAIGAIWAGYGAAGLAEGLWLQGSAGAPVPPTRRLYILRAARTAAVVLLLLMPAAALRNTMQRVDQSENGAARRMWDDILAALPTGDAILVSNDRDEIPAFFYLQQVEGQAPGVSALHPLMAPDDRFSDIGATIDTALIAGDGTPVYLIKQMPGLEIKYDLAPQNVPVVRVLGPISAVPTITVDRPLAGLTLLGYDWAQRSDGVQVTLHWRVDERAADNYTTSVQLFDAGGDRLAQSDRPPGGDYYPTSLWKPGEHLVEEHLLAVDWPLPEGGVILQVGMYAGPSMEAAGPPLQIPLEFSAQ